MGERAEKQRLVILGASNVARSFPGIVQTVRGWGRPFEVLTAMGHGRSYGRDSRVLGTHLPSILTCGLWAALRDRPELPTTAWLTDIGNDLAHGAQAAELVEHVARCGERLEGRVARIVLTQLPLASLLRVAPLRYALFRAVLFPRSTLTHAQALDRARETNARLQELAAARAWTLVEPRAEWYGFDPIHVRRKHARAAWNLILSHAPHAVPIVLGATREKNFSKLRRVVRRARPAVYRWLGRERCCAQPSVTWPDGSELSLF